MSGVRIVPRNGYVALQSKDWGKGDAGRITREYDRCCGLFILVTQPALDLADSAVRDAAGELRKAGMYRQGVKHHANAALAALGAIGSQMGGRLREARTGDQRQLFLDYLDTAQDDLRKHAEILRYTLAQFALNEGWGHPSACGAAWLADALLGLAAEIFSSFMRQVSKEISPTVEELVRHTFGFADPLPAARQWALALEELGKAQGAGMGLRRKLPDFSRDGNVRAAYLVVLRKLVDWRSMEKAGDAAYSLSHAEKDNDEPRQEQP